MHPTEQLKAAMKMLAQKIERFTASAALHEKSPCELFRKGMEGDARILACTAVDVSGAYAVATAPTVNQLVGVSEIDPRVSERFEVGARLYQLVFEDNTTSCVCCWRTSLALECLSHQAGSCDCVVRVAIARDAAQQQAVA